MWKNAPPPQKKKFNPPWKFFNPLENLTITRNISQLPPWTLCIDPLKNFSITPLKFLPPPRKILNPPEKISTPPRKNFKHLPKNYQPFPKKSEPPEISEFPPPPKKNSQPPFQKFVNRPPIEIFSTPLKISKRPKICWQATPPPLPTYLFLLFSFSFYHFSDIGHFLIKIFFFLIGGGGGRVWTPSLNTPFNRAYGNIDKHCCSYMLMIN